MKLEILFKYWKIKPNNIDLYKTAFSHTTYSNENKKIESYERLEFLGDALIEFEVSKFLFDNYDLSEGQMTLLRAKNVSENALSFLSKKYNLGNYISLGKGSRDLKDNNSILGDVFESFIAAVYFDLGRNKALEIFEKTIFKEIRKNWNKEAKDSKTLLQEFLQASHSQPVKYKTRAEKNKTFSSIVKYEGYNFGIGYGSNKKEAEQDAAKNALSKLKN